jgi:hypothetical protein
MAASIFEQMLEKKAARTRAITSASATTSSASPLLSDDNDNNDTRRGNVTSNSTLSSSLTVKEEVWQREKDVDSLRYTGLYSLPWTTTSRNSTNVTDKNTTTISWIDIDEDYAQLGTRIWDCATLMAKFFEYQLEEKQSDNIYGKVCSGKVLELGSGSGLTAIALALLGASVIATEYGPVMDHLTLQCKKNNTYCSPSSPPAAGKVVPLELDWYKEPSPYFAQFGMPFDTIIMADCTLTAKDSPFIVDVMLKYYTKGVTTIYVGACSERDGTASFIEIVKTKFATCETLPSSTFHPEYQSKRLIILKIQ